MEQNPTPEESERDDDRQGKAADEQDAEDQLNQIRDDQEAPMDKDGWGTGFNIDKGKTKFDAINAYQKGKEAARMKVIASPTMPSQKVVDEHNVCHIPYAPVV